MTSQFYVYLNSKDSMDLYPSNNNTSFTVKLPRYVSLAREHWQVGLVEIKHPTIYKTVVMNVLCDLCEGSIAGGEYLPLLRQVHAHQDQVFYSANQQSFNPILYKTIIPSGFQHITITIKAAKGTGDLSFNELPFYCALHFK
ncbi:unnamed protein product, partial [Owenia fusiformis]